MASETTVPGHDHLPHTIRASTPDGSSLQDRDAEIKRIKQLIDELTGELSHCTAESVARLVALKKKLNSIQSLTRSLPPEILTPIFRYLCSFHDPKSDTHPLLALGAVSSYWRQAAYSNPQLWTSITFAVPSELAPRRRIGQLLCLFFKNSGQLSLTLKLCFNKQQFFTTDLVDSTVDELILENLHRIQSLDVVHPTMGWRDLPPTGLSGLADVSLLCNPFMATQSKPGPDICFLSGSSSLRRLKLHGRNFSPLTFEIHLESYDALRFVDLDGVSVNDCINLLIGCHNLVEFKLHDLAKHADMRHDTALLTLGAEPIVRNKVKVFEWGEYPYWVNYEFLQSIHFPSLRTLGWELYPGSRSDTSLATSHTFLSNLPPTLSTLQLRVVNSSSGVADITDIQPLLCKENIKHLILFDFTLDNLHSVLEGLSGEGIFPGLNKLTIDEFQPDNDHPRVENMDFPIQRTWAALIARFLERVFSMQKDRYFCIETVTFRVDWTDKVKHLLKCLVRSGMKLEIIEDSKPVEWL